MEPANLFGGFLSDESNMNFYNEMADAQGGVRAHYRAYQAWLDATPQERIERKRAEADLAFHRVGITFAVYLSLIHI